MMELSDSFSEAHVLDAEPLGRCHALCPHIKTCQADRSPLSMIVSFTDVALKSSVSKHIAE